MFTFSFQAMTETAHCGHGHVICMSILSGVFSKENTPEAYGCIETYTSLFLPYNQVGEMIIMNDLA